jgi:Terpene cyclase DEP1
MAYLGLAIAGLIGQAALVGAFVAGNGVDPAEFADQMFSSTIAALALADLLACAVVFLLWMPREAARVGIRRRWPFALATLGGLCFAYPLFLYARERRGTRAAFSAPPQPHPARLP